MVNKWFSVLVYTPKKDHFVTIFDDITDKIILEDQLKQAAKLEAIGLLAGGIAHDFNNILTVIRGHTELLINKTKGIPTSDAHTYVNTKLNKIDKASARAETLTKQLLAFGRKQILAPKVINLNEVFKTEIGVLSTLIREDIEIQKHLDVELGNCFADSNQVSLVMMNLIINARDAIPEQEIGRITIETKNIFFDDDHVERKKKLIGKGKYVMFAVTDDGIGMDKDIQKRIFEPFFTTKEMGKGVGLGLSTSYGIIKQSGGFVWVYSEVGQGTTFKVYFPRVDEETNNDTIQNEYVSDLTGNETLLVVEDEKEVRLLICETLKELGYKVLSAPDGIDAIELLKTSQIKIDILVTDVVMPRMDGRELAVQLSDFIPNLKVLYMSGYTDNTIVHRGILDPGTNFIQKPVTPTSLAKKIREILDNGT
jgi:signal transduction histidine kinase